MIFTVKGAISEIKTEFPNAIICPCYNHALNLSISKSSTVQGVRNAVGTVNEIATFFMALLKRNTIIKRILRGDKNHVQNERHESVIQFKTEIENIAEALGNFPKTIFIEKLLQGEIIMWKAKWKKEKDKTFYYHLQNISIQIFIIY